MLENSELSVQITNKLSHLGFTKLESEVYLYLLINGSSTGYAIAKGIGKAVANVYKATENLANKGALEHAMADSKSCTAVPWLQLLSTHQRHYETNIESLSKCLEQLPTAPQEEQVYQLKKFDHVIQQSIRIIDESETLLLADIEPEAMKWLESALISAAQRGVEVKVKVYQHIDLPGVNVTLRLLGEQIYQKTDDINFSLCADGKEMLLALITTDNNNVIQSFRTKSALMNMGIFNSLLYGLILTELKQVIPTGDIAQAQKILAETAHLHPFSSENTVFENYRNRYKN